MLSSRKALIFFAALSALLLVLIFCMLLGNGNHRTFYSGETASFASPEEEFEITVTRSGKDESIRESLIAKLENRTAPLRESSIDEEVAEEEIAETLPETQNGIPLGDGKISTGPQAGHIFACSQNFETNNQVAGEWIRDAYWFPEDKAAVDGSVRWQNQVSLTASEGARLIETNGLPNHTTGEFPIRAHDDAYAFDVNQYSIAPQSILIQLPQNPQSASVPNCIPTGMIGVGLNGVALFAGLDAQGNDAPAHEMQDHCGGSPDKSGAYHYHHESECLLNAYYEGAQSTLLGYALDGFGIFSSIEDGAELSNNDLDTCHGHSHDIPWNGVITSIYHYHMTDEYPYSLGCFMGTPTYSVTRENSLQLSPELSPQTAPQS